MRKINMLVIHCADTTPDMDIGAREINDWHVKERGWKAIGYAYVIRRSGALELGRDLDKDGDVVEEVGAHAAGYNANSIGICLVGGKSKKGGAENNFTPHQFKMLAWLVGELESKFPGCDVLGHRDLPGVTKQCPSFDVREWRKSIG